MKLKYKLQSAWKAKEALSSLPFLLPQATTQVVRLEDRKNSKHKRALGLRDILVSPNNNQIIMTSVIMLCLQGELLDHFWCHVETLAQRDCISVAESVILIGFSSFSQLSYLSSRQTILLWPLLLPMNQVI